MATRKAFPIKKLFDIPKFRRTSHKSTKAQSLASVLITAASLLFFTSQALADVPPLQVSGNKILVGGEAKALGGHSLFWHNVPAAGDLYSAAAVSRLKNDWNSKVIRAAIGVEVSFNANRTYNGDPVGSLAAVDRVVNAAVANDMYVIIDFHTHHADEQEGSAHSFFHEVSSRYSHLNNVIYEVFNEPEWCGEQGRWASTIKPYAERVIGTIRANDSKNLIIVGTTCFSQDVDVAARNPISDHNVAYTLHFYAATPAHQQPLRNKAQQALNDGAALFVTEWGSTTFTGDGFVDEEQTRIWIRWLNERGISHTNWSASTQSESSAIWNSDMSYTQSGNLVGELVRETNGETTDIIDGPCNMNSAPGKAQVESFCQAKGIQFEDTDDAGGGQNIGYVDDGDWITFDVNIPASGQYFVDYRVASEVGGGRIRMETHTPVGSVSVDNTGGWQSWTTVSDSVNLSAGSQTIKLVAESGGWNLNWFELRKGDVCVGNGCSETKRFEAEYYTIMDGVELENTEDNGGGQNVGYIDTGDWMVYEGALPASSNNSYVVSYRVAREPGGVGTLKLEQQGGAVSYGQIDVPSTNGWQNWTTISHTVNIPSDAPGFAIAAVSGGWNINWIEIRANQTPCPGGSCGSAILIQAEDYDYAYDTSAGNNGDSPHNGDVDIQSTTDAGGGFNVGWTEAGEWLDYEFTASSAGNLVAHVRVASNESGSSFQLQIDGNNAGNALSVESTGGWQEWTTKTINLGQVSAGNHVLSVEIINGPFNLNWIELK